MSENIAVKNDTIFYVGKKQNFIAKDTIDASNKIISPGFVNMLSWGYNTLMQDGRSLSDLKQGVTLEVFGEGTSPGPRGSIENIILSDLEKPWKSLKKVEFQQILPHI